MPIAPLRTLKEWRAGRRALGELERLRSREQTVLTAPVEQKLEEAASALERGDRAFAAELWDAAVAIHPGAARSSKLTATILAQLGRVDEAEAAMRDGQRRAPNNPVFMEGYALAAEFRPDVPQAILRWRATRKRFPREPMAYWSESNMLVRAGRLDEAEAMINRAAKAFPGSVVVAFHRALVADARQDWAASLERWTTVHGPFRHHVGISGAAIALARLGRVEEAEALLADGMYRFPMEPVMFMASARAAESRGDWTEAARRWAAVRRKFPKMADGYVEGMRVLAAANDRAGIEALIEQARQERPDLALAAPAGAG